MKRSLFLVISIALLGFLFSGCVRMYKLPDPGPKSEWVNSLEEAPSENREEKTLRFLEAKRVAVQIYAATAEKDWDRALSLMTKDSIAFLDAYSNGAGASASLEKGLLSDGKIDYNFDVLSDVFIDDLNDIVDELDGVDEEEGPERKVLHAVSDSGKSNPLILLLENGKWRLSLEALMAETFP